MSNDFPPPPADGGGYPPPPSGGGYPPLPPSPGGGYPPPPPGGGYPPPPTGGYPAPGGGYGAPGPEPQNYLVWSILTTLFCCLPLGVVSIVFASQVSGKYHSGDYAGAVRSSESAKKWAIWSAIAAAVLVVLYILVAGIAVTANR